MENQRHTMHNLFSQLGLPAESADIDRFIAAHSPLDDAIKLHAAPFWTPSQASFLCNALQVDADWAGVVDALNHRLRARQI